MSGISAKPQDNAKNTDDKSVSSITVLICSCLVVVLAVIVMYKTLGEANGCCRDTAKSIAELRNRLENIHKLLDDLNQDLRNTIKSAQYPVIIEDGTRWRAFWWYKKSSGWPRCSDDVLEGEYGGCDPSASYCFGRLPDQLSETGAEMLGKDSSGNIYRWSFDATNPTAHAVWQAFHDHVQTPAGTVVNSHVWNPKIVAGNGPKEQQDSFMYRVEYGVASLLLDDDNCDCLTSLSLGHGMCRNTFDSQFGPANRFGVDLLFDTHCQTPSPDNGLTLYFKDEDNCAGVNCGPGRKCIDDIDTYICVGS